MADVITKDLVIVGGGPAGLSAAIYAKRALLDTVVLVIQDPSISFLSILSNVLSNSLCGKLSGV